MAREIITTITPPPPDSDSIHLKTVGVTKDGRSSTISDWVYPSATEAKKDIKRYLDRQINLLRAFFGASPVILGLGASLMKAGSESQDETVSIAGVLVFTTGLAVLGTTALYGYPRQKELENELGQIDKYIASQDK